MMWVVIFIGLPLVAILSLVAVFSYIAATALTACLVIAVNVLYTVAADSSMPGEFSIGLFIAAQPWIIMCRGIGYTFIKS